MAKARSAREALEALDPEQRQLLREAPLPTPFEPMKATLVDQSFSDPAWVFEPKLDGVRALSFRDGGAVRLFSRTGKAMSGYPELVDALEAEKCERFVADGEIVAFDGGVTSFAKLQRRMQLADPEAARRTRVAVYLYVFDLVWLEGFDLRELPLRTRKALLRGAFTFEGRVRYMSHRNEGGEELFRAACERGLEGLIAKRAESRYVNRRTRDWLKLKCSHEQEFVIGGFTAPKGSRTDFGALLVGYYEEGELCYAGKVGTGFDQRFLRELGRTLRRIERDSPPFLDVHPVPPGTHWVEPELVAEVGFGEWTRDGRLRHPRFLGLRDDKRPHEVVRERPT
jgi:bifunctional non-homologous end joining protein LigD